MAQSSQKRPMVAIITMFFIFAMISFVTNMAAPFGNIWGFRYAWAGMAGNLMNFTAYLFMGIPAGNMLIKYGYKKTALIALAVGAVGLSIQLLSSVVGDNVIVIGGENPTTLNLFIYLFGALVCGFCVCMLNTVVCPMLNLLGGGGNKGNQLLQFGGALNSFSGTMTPFFVGALIGVLSKNTMMSAVTPLLFIGMGIFITAFVILIFMPIPEPNQTGVRKVKYAHSPWNFRHTVLGVVGIFFYVGIEIGIPGTLNFYLADQSARGAEVTGEASAIAGTIVAIYWLLMLVGRTLSGFISGAVSSKTQLTFVSATAIILIMLAIFLPKTTTITVPEAIYSDGAQVPVSAFLLVLCGLCTSIMWGGIFNLAVEGLGKYTAQASGIFMMMVVGGGVMPLIQNGIANAVGYMASYWLVIAMLAYLLFYGLVGSKNVNTDIPVEEEEVDPRNL